MYTGGDVRELELLVGGAELIRSPQATYVVTGCNETGFTGAVTSGLWIQ